VKSFLGAKDYFEKSEIVIIGVPFDATSSFRAGSRFAPDSIRFYSESIETYSPYFDYDIEEINFYDYGNIEVTISNFFQLRKALKEKVKFFLKKGKKVLSIGGEHLITLPIIEAYHEFYNDLKIIQLDAHLDLRDTYLNEKYSHATVMRRISEIISVKNIFQFGIRSGTKEEFLFANRNTNFFPFSLPDLNNFLDKFLKTNIYLTLDLDVFDPGVMPGTGNPEPGGIGFNDFMKFLNELTKVNANIVGVDVVELSPEYDKSGNSSVFAAKVIRELLVILKNL